MSGARHRDCERCGTRLPVNQGFVTWCHSCGWNLTAPRADEAPTGRFERLYEAAGAKLGDRLADRLARSGKLEPTLTPAKLISYVIACGVYLVSLLFVAAGVAFAALLLPNLFALAVGALLVSIGLMLRPRFGKPPQEDRVPADDAPALHALVAEVAAALDVPRTDILVVDHEFNASWAVLGLRRRRVLTLGLPLLSALDPQERVALVAHELAHGRNGDSGRGLFVGSAVRALADIYWIVGPEDLSDREPWELGFFDRIVNVLLFVISRPAYWLLLLELHLLLRDSQRAEYLADALAARVAGTDAVVSLSEKMLLSSTFHAVVQKSAQRGSELDLFAELASVVGSVPDREKERRRRVARLEGARLSETHPPTGKRIELLERRRRLQPEVLLDTDRSEAIDAELARFRGPLQQRLVEEHRDALYY
jgi:Zn-dependent protease with chaperone function